MYVRFTDWSYRAMLLSVADDAETHEQFTIDAVKPLKRRWIVGAPYVAWRTARDSLHARSYGPRGGRLPYGKESNYSALTAIQRELNYVDNHPAMGGYAMYGLHCELFPVWKLDPTPRWPQKYSSYPQPGREFVVLTPKTRAEQSGRVGIDITWWVEKPSAEGRLMDESLHLRLRRRTVR